MQFGACSFPVLALCVLSSEGWPQSVVTTHSLLGSQVIQHVIIIVQENRSPDNLFHDTNLMAKGADIASYGLNSKGQTIELMPIRLDAGYDLDH